MRGRPTCTLRLTTLRGEHNRDVAAFVAPNAALAGDTLEVAVSMDFPGETPVDKILLYLTTELTIIPDHRRQYAHSRVLSRSVAALSGEARMPKGKTILRARFEIPPNAPPTYAGQLFRFDHTLRLEVEIPWWRDVKAEYTARIEPRPSLRAAPLPRNTTTASGTDEPFVEVTIDDTVVAPGDVLTGAVAVANLRGRKCKGVRAALVGVETHRGPLYELDPLGIGAQGASRPGPRFVFPFLDVPNDGKSASFSMRLPESAAAEFAVDTLDGAMRVQQSSLAWMVELTASLSLRSDVVCRVPIALRSLAGPQSAARRVTDVGVGRWRATWQAAGAPLGLTPSERAPLELSGSLSGVAVRVFPDPESETPAIAADLSGLDWGLGLEVTARRIRMFAGERDDDGFSKRYRVEARDAAQLRGALSKELRQELLAFDDVHLDDHTGRVRSVTRSLDQPAVGVFLGRLPALARALARAATNPPPPPLVKDALPAYRACADVTRARLITGSMSLFGANFDGAKFDIETQFDGAKPTGTLVTHWLEPHLEKAFDPTPDGDDVAALPPKVREIHGELCAAGRTEVDPQSIRLALPFVVDPEDLRSRLAQLAALGRGLRGETERGPYR